MSKKQDPLGRLRITAPCPTTWDSMAGDERVRHCTLCNLNVFNFAEMSREEVHQLLERTEGRVCARLYRRADGTVLTRDCPTGLRALRRRASRVAVALTAALLALPSFAFGKSPRVRMRGSKVRLDVKRAATQQPAMFRGVVRDRDGQVIPEVTIAVRSEESKREIIAYTDVDGAFSFASLNDGFYRVDVTLQGFKPATMEHLHLKESEVTHATVTLKLDASSCTVTVGAVSVDPLRTYGGVSATFMQDFINKLPL